MKIRYDDNGRIIGVYADHLEVPGDVVAVSEKTLKKDFKATFSQGKYRVENGQLAKVPNFRKRSTNKLEALFVGGLSAEDDT